MPLISSLPQCRQRRRLGDGSLTLLLRRCLSYVFTSCAMLCVCIYVVLMPEQVRHKQLQQQQQLQRFPDVDEFVDRRPLSLGNNMSSPIPIRNNLYNGNPAALLRQLVLNKTTHVFELSNGSQVVWSYYDHVASRTVDSQQHMLPAFVNLSLISAATNEHEHFVQVLVDFRTAPEYISDLHPAFVYLNEKSRELYFMGRILEKFGGFYLSPTSIFYRPFLKFLNLLRKLEFCLVIHPKAKPSLVGPVRFAAQNLTDWKETVHALLDRHVAVKNKSPGQLIASSYLKQLTIPSILELDQLDWRYQRPNVCPGAHGRYALYISPRDLERQYGLNASQEEILLSSSSTEFSAQFKACCVWQSEQERDLVFQLREVQTPFE